MIQTVDGLDQDLVFDRYTKPAALGDRMEVEASATGTRVVRSFLRDAAEMARARWGLHF